MTGKASVVLAGDLGRLPEKLKMAGVETAGESAEPVKALALALSADAGAIVASGEAALSLTGALEALDPSERPALIALTSGGASLPNATVCSDPDEAVAAVQRLSGGQARKNTFLRRRISELLAGLCLPAGRSEHRYVLAALLMMASEPELSGLEPETLYPELARRFGVSEERVSESLDHAVRTVWRRCDSVTLSRMFHGKASRPTADEFLKTLFGSLYSTLGKSLWSPQIY